MAQPPVLGTPPPTQAPPLCLPCLTSLDLDADTGPRWLASHPWDLALGFTAVSPAPSLSSQPPLSIFCEGGTRATSGQVASSHSPCSCDCLRPPAARMEETGPGRWASGQAAPGRCWQEDSGA